VTPDRHFGDERLAPCVLVNSCVHRRQPVHDNPAHVTDRLTTLPWQLLGEERSNRFAERFEPPCEALLARVDVTAGTNYQPASRIHG